MSELVFFPKPCLFLKNIFVKASNRDHMSPLSLWNHGVIKKVKDILQVPGDLGHPGAWNIIFLPISINSNLFLQCVLMHLSKPVIWIFIHSSHEKLSTSWASACFLCRRMMNKNSCSDQKKNCIKGYPGKGKNSLRSPGAGQGQNKNRNCTKDAKISTSRIHRAR